MKIPLKKQINPLLILLLIASDVCFGLKNLNAENNTVFPNYPIKEISNFQVICDQIFQIVAGKMGLKINENIPKPVILTDKQISRQKFNSYLGWDVEVVCPYYFFKKNTVVIPLNCKLDSLAHELVHYFQVMYRNENLDFSCGPYIENLEMEAVSIQRWFKSNFLDSHELDQGIAVKFPY
jgi:hypothetical protein